jgi:hypothetical protein
MLGFEVLKEKFSISEDLKILQSFSFLKTRHRCCAPILALGDYDLKLESSLCVGQVDLKVISSVSFLKTRQRCCAPILALGD